MVLQVQTWSLILPTIVLYFLIVEKTRGYFIAGDGMDWPAPEGLLLCWGNPLDNLWCGNPSLAV